MMKYYVIQIVQTTTYAINTMWLINYANMRGLEELRDLGIARFELRDYTRFERITQHFATQELRGKNYATMRRLKELRDFQMVVEAVDKNFKNTALSLGLYSGFRYIKQTKNAI